MPQDFLFVGRFIADYNTQNSAADVDSKAALVFIKNLSVVGNPRIYSWVSDFIMSFISFMVIPLAQPDR